MDETQWLTGKDVRELLVGLGKTSDRRKLRLFAVACCRPLLRMDLHTSAVVALETAERYAEGTAKHHELREARGSVLGPREHNSIWAASAAMKDTCEHHPWSAAILATPRAIESEGLAAIEAPAWQATRSQALARDGLDPEDANDIEAYDAWEMMEAENKPRKRQVALLHCIFGNPFRPVTFDPPSGQSWSIAVVQVRTRGVAGCWTVCWSRNRIGGGRSQ